MGLLVDDFHGGFTRYLSAAQALRNQVDTGRPTIARGRNRVRPGSSVSSCLGSSARSPRSCTSPPPSPRSC